MHNAHAKFLTKEPCALHGKASNIHIHFLRNLTTIMFLGKAMKQIIKSQKIVYFIRVIDYKALDKNYQSCTLN